MGQPLKKCCHDMLPACQNLTHYDLFWGWQIVKYPLKCIYCISYIENYNQMIVIVSEVTATDINLVTQVWQVYGFTKGCLDSHFCCFVWVSWSDESNDDDVRLSGGTRQIQVTRETYHVHTIIQLQAHRHKLERGLGKKYLSVGHCSLTHQGKVMDGVAGIKH